MIHRTLMVLFLAVCVAFAADFTNWNTENSGLSSNTVKAIVIDENGNKWFGTDQGLVGFDGSNWKAHKKTDEQQTLADDNIHAIAFENSSYGPELWIGTENGVTVVSIPSIDALTFATPYRTDNRPLINNRVTAVAVDEATHQRWFGTPFGVSVFGESGWTTYSTETEPPLAFDNVTDIGIDNTEGWRYITTSGHDDYAVSRLRETVDAVTAASPYDFSWSGLLSTNINSVFVDTDGSQWFATSGGVSYHDTTETKAKWENFTVAEGLVSDFVNVVTKYDDNTMLAGTQGGLSMIDYRWVPAVDEWGFEYDTLSYDILNFTTTQGLPSNEINDVAVDGDGTIWLATNNGVSQYSGIVGVKRQIVETQKAFGLIQNYPNPFNPSTTISYQLESYAHVQLSVINMRGQVVQRLVETTQSAGSHEVVWNARSRNTAMPSGIYMAVLRVQNADGGYTDTMKMLYVK